MSRFGQPIRVDESNFDGVQLYDMRKVVRPVGPWRFLTPLDVVHKGDLFRIVAAESYDEDAAYNANWSPVTESIGETVGEMSNCWEIIRALEHGYTVPMFDLSPPDDDEEDDE